MDEIPLIAQFGVLFLLLIFSGFFAMAETAMMATNRHRLRHAAENGSRGAQLALGLLAKVDRLISLILLGNTMINAAAAMLTGHIALTLFGEEKWVLEAGTLFVTFCLLVFSEITPKVVGATYPDWLTPRISFILVPLLRIAYPVLWFVNLFVNGLLKLTRLQAKPGHETQKMSPEELRSVVLEAGNFIPSEHRSILLNLFELERVTAGDIMTPRSEIETIDIAAPIDQIRDQLATSYHSRVVVYENDPGNVIGILQLKRLMHDAFSGSIDHDTLRSHLVEPYYIPAATPIYTQMQFFRENRQRLGLVVDEYGEIQGLVSMENAVEEIVGKFTTSAPGTTDSFKWGEDGTVLIDGLVALRELNRQLDLGLPLEGPRTLNGLILEHLRDIPEVGLGVRVHGVAMEIVQTQDRKVKMVRLHRPAIE
jgi:Mg2+/Co2+ transporter CorB